MNCPARCAVRSFRDSRASWSRVVLCLAALSLLSPSAIVAQQWPDVGLSAGADRATRAELQRLVTRAESLAKLPGLSAIEQSQLSSTVQFARGRLQLGDFEVGDRIAVFVQDQPALTDTFAVRAGRQLLLPIVGELALAGVLRAELQERLTAHVGQYIRDPIVRVTPLIRLSVIGAIARPGYYILSADLPLAELVMRAGGPTSDGDLAKVQLRRGGAELMTSMEAGPAIGTGATIDQLNLRSGDVVFVGERRRVGAINLIQVFSGLAGVAVAVFALQNSHHR